MSQGVCDQRSVTPASALPSHSSGLFSVRPSLLSPPREPHTHRAAQIHTKQLRALNASCFYLLSVLKQGIVHLVTISNILSPLITIQERVSEMEREEEGMGDMKGKGY